MMTKAFKVGWRGLRRSPGYTLIHLLGLSVALAASLLILLFIVHELSFDRHHDDAHRLYRLVQSYKRGETVQATPLCQASMGPLVETEVPGVQAAARLFTYSWRETVLLEAGERTFYENRFFLADPAIFSLFKTVFIQGRPDQALENPHALVLTRSSALRLFGELDVLGRRVAVQNLGGMDFTVSAVVEDLPANTHFHYDFLASTESGNLLYWPSFSEGWRGLSFYTYVKLLPGVQTSAVLASIESAFRQKSPDSATTFSLSLQPVRDIHLDGSKENEIEPGGSRSTLWLFAAVMALLLSVAVINYVNLATAKAALRASEVGIRKAVGALKGQLVRQFLSESLLLAFMAFVPALLMAELALPLFSRLVGRELTLLRWDNLGFIIMALLLLMLLGVAAGLYPALVLSGPRPIQALKGGSMHALGRSRFRHGLVLIQFMISVACIYASLGVARQIHFVRHSAMGYERERILILPLKDNDVQARASLLRQDLSGLPGVVSVTACSQLPCQVRYPHEVWHERVDEQHPPVMQLLSVDVDFLETFDIALADGRDFQPDATADQGQGYLLNEAAARSLGWQEAVGRPFMLSNRGLRRPQYTPGRVLGVVKDFHFQSLHAPITPLVVELRPGRARYLALRLAPGDLAVTVKTVQAGWSRVQPDRPFDYFFMDDRFDALYRAETQLGLTFKGVTVLALLIALLGLVGLAAHAAARRTKEMGIRKVLGASESHLAWLFYGEFIRLNLLGAALGLPLAYWGVARWLSGFAYRASLGWTPVLVSVLASALAVGVTLAYFVVRSARANPVKALKYE